MTQEHRIFRCYITNVAQKTSMGESMPGVTWLAVNYDDQSELVRALRGIHTVLSFIQDPENKSQKSLIDAAIVAGVKRFAPSEWGR